MAKDSEGFTCFWRIENFRICKPKHGLVLQSPTFEVGKVDCHLKLRPVRNDFLILKFFKRGPQSGDMKIRTSLLENAGWTTHESRALVSIERDEYGNSCIYRYDITNPENKYILEGALAIAVHMYTRDKYPQRLMRSEMVNEEEMRHWHMGESGTFVTRNFENFLTSNETFPRPTSTTGVQAENQTSTTGVQTENQTSTVNTQTVVGNVFKDTDELVRFFGHDQFRFVTLRTESKDFLVYKALLYSKSPVFKTMFDNELGNNNIVNITDIDVDTLSLVLEFLHLQPLNGLKWKAVVNLYYAAHKYQIDLLRKKCVSFMKHEISVDNICEAFTLADVYKEENLSRSAMKYFCRNSKLILLSGAWKDLMTYRTELASKILHELAKRM